MKNKLRRTFVGELRKLNEKHTYIKFAIAILVIGIFYMCIIGFANGLLGAAGMGGGLPTETFESNKQAITAYETQINIIENGDKATDGLSALQRKTTLANLKSSLAKYQYLDANNLNASDFDDFGGASNFQFNTSMSLMIQVIGQIIILACLVLAIRTYSGELAAGTLKMQLIRPIKRSTVLTGKSLSVFAVGCIALFASTILISVAELAICGAHANKLLFVLDHKFVGVISPLGHILLQLLNQVTTLFVMIQFAHFICSLTRAKSTSGGIAIALIIFFFGSTVEGFVPFLPAFGFFSNLDWLSSFSLSGMPFYSSTLWSSLLVTLMWCGGMVYTNYFLFSRRDMS
ncbi:MAG: ABC transporter permease subunit [Clostridia bacterium]